MSPENIYDIELNFYIHYLIEVLEIRWSYRKTCSSKIKWRLKRSILNTSYEIWKLNLMWGLATNLIILFLPHYRYNYKPICKYFWKVLSKRVIQGWINSLMSDFWVFLYPDLKGSRYSTKIISLINQL